MARLTYRYVGDDASGDPLFENLPPPSPANDTKVVSDNSQLGRALAFARAGFSVFPCHPQDVIDPDTGKILFEAKSPLAGFAPNGFKSATRDENKINHWFTCRHDALISIPTGKTTGLAIVDIDRHREDEDGFESLAERGIELPPTFVNPTRNNGEHWIYARPDVDKFPG